jgi:hypothetical protein
LGGKGLSGQERKIVPQKSRQRNRGEETDKQLDKMNGNGEIKPASARKLELYPFRGGESETGERESGSGKSENVKEGMKGIVSGQRDG